jgi:hypothetical protein
MPYKNKYFFFLVKMSSVLYGKKEMGDEGEFEKGVSRFKSLPNDRPNSFFQQQKKAEEIKEEIPNRKKKNKLFKHQKT